MTPATTSVEDSSAGGAAPVTMAPVTVTLVQMRATRDVDENLTVIEREAREAAADGCRIVAFPEASMVNFGPNLEDYAQPLDGPFASRLADLARELGIVIVVGMFTPGSDPAKVCNTVLVTGEGIHRGYNKIHLFDSFGTRESDTTDEGSEPFTFDVDGMTIGIATCFDVRFPNLFYALADRGAQAVIVPTNWAIGKGKADAWQVLARARAMDTTMWVLGPAQYGGDRTIPFGVGGTIAVDPLGRVQHECGNERGRITVSVGPDAVAEARDTLPVLALRRDLGSR